MNFVIGIIMVAVGIVIEIKPTAIWKIQQFLYVKNGDGEPTKFWFILARFSGVLAAAVGVAVMVYG